MNRPWMPLYVADYRGGTARLSTLEHGAYLLLIMEYWQIGGLPDDDAQLARIVGLSPTAWRKIKPTIQAFFFDGWKHKRIEFELTEAARISAAGKAGGQASGRARRQRSANDQPTTNERSFNDHSNDHSNDQPTIREALPSPSQRRKKDTADAVSSSSIAPYAFESGVIRLKQKDFDQWKQAFEHLDLAAELIALTEWAGQQPKWFHPVSAALAKRNREAKLRLDQHNSPDKPPKDFDWRDALV